MRRNHWFGVAVLLALLGTSAPVEAKGSVRITFTTTPSGGNYAPNNVVALWIQNGAGAHQRTVGVWSAVRTQYLISYRAAAGVNDANNLPADAVSGASRSNHQGNLVALWNLKDKAGNVVPDGTYTIRLELADENATTAGQNNQGTFTFVKGPTAQVQNALANGGFTNVTIDYDPNRVVCGDGVVDGPETCDFTVAGSCVVNQTGCASADKCMPSTFTGSPMACTADCVPQPVTECINNDGCCLDSCTQDNDTDCIPGNMGSNGGGENPDENLSGGCSSGAGGGLAVFAMFSVALVARRRRRR
jgi:MYXO-CTERM domain-containing protein